MKPIALATGTYKANTELHIEKSTIRMQKKMQKKADSGNVCIFFSNQLKIMMIS